MALAIREIATGALSRDALYLELEFILGLLRHHGEPSVWFEVGWGASLPMDELWDRTQVDLGEVLNRVRECERNGVFHFGNADIALRGSLCDMSVCFSHHGSVHLKSSDVRVLQEVKDHWIASGFTIYRRVSAAAPFPSPGRR